MELSPKQQIVEAIRGSENILAITHRGPDGDAVGSLVAVSKVLEKIGKKVTTVCADNIPAVFSFLDGNQVVKNISGNRDFVISLDVSNVKADKFYCYSQIR